MSGIRVSPGGMHARSEEFTTAFPGTAPDGELSSIFVRGRVDLSALDAAEQFRLNMYVLATRDSGLTHIFSFDERNLDLDVWETMQLGLRSISLLSPKN